MRCPTDPHRPKIATGLLTSVVAVGLVGLVVGCAWALPQLPDQHTGTPITCHSGQPGESPTCHATDHLDHRAILPPVAILNGSCKILERGSQSGSPSAAFRTTAPVFHPVSNRNRSSLDHRRSHFSRRIHLLHQVFLN